MIPFGRYPGLDFHQRIKVPMLGEVLDVTVDGWNLKQPPGMVLKPYK